MEGLHPTIQEPPSSVDTNLINPVNLTCTAEGSPAPSYLWYKDGVLIAGETMEYLYIEETQPEDRGNYTCVAINEGGQVESDPARLKIPGEAAYMLSTNAINNQNTKLHRNVIKPLISSFIGIYQYDVTLQLSNSSNASELQNVRGIIHTIVNGITTCNGYCYSYY